VVTRVGVLTTRLRLSNSYTLSTWSASVRFLKGPSAGPSAGPVSAHQNPSLSGSTWLAQVICNFPLTKWLGHSSKVAAQHYLMTRNHHFEDVVGGGDSIPLAGADAVQANPIECDARIARSMALLQRSSGR
jgi:hypothetical protein